MPRKPKPPTRSKASANSTASTPLANPDAAYDTLYTEYALLARGTGTPLYHFETWQKAVQILDPLVTAARGEKPAVWAMGAHPGGGSHAFEKIGWDAKSHQTWPEGAPQRPPKSQVGSFSYFSLWKPAWPTARKEGFGPDLYFTLWDATHSGHKVPGCDYGFLLAIAEQLPTPLRQAAEQAARSIAQLLDLTLSAKAEHIPWGRLRPAIKKNKKVYDTIDFDRTMLIHSLGRLERAEPPTFADLGEPWTPFP